MDDWRQHAEQDLRLWPDEPEMAAEHRDSAIVVQPDQRAIAGAEKMALPVVGWQDRIACDPERPAAGQKEAVALLEKLRLHLDGGKGVGWLFALSDKHVGAAITAIH